MQTIRSIQEAPVFVKFEPTAHTNLYWAYQDKEQIIKVELDLTHIYRMQEFSNSSDYKVILEYSLIGEISPIVVNIESSD